MSTPRLTLRTSRISSLDTTSFATIDDLRETKGKEKLKVRLPRSRAGSRRRDAEVVIVQMDRDGEKKVEAKELGEDESESSKKRGVGEEQGEVKSEGRRMSKLGESAGGIEVKLETELGTEQPV